MDPKKLLKLTQEWQDDPRSEHWIDDGALYVLMIVARRMLASASEFSYALTALKPIEWSHTDMLKFLVRVSEEYKFPIKNLGVMIHAFTENYEVPTIDDDGNIDPEYEQAWKEYSAKNADFEECKKKYEHLPGGGFKECMGKLGSSPKKYGGAYKWALDRAEIKETEKDKMFARFFDNTFTIEDVKLVLRLGTSHFNDNLPEDSEEKYSYDICKSIANWISFDIDPGKEIGIKIENDLRAYLEHFIDGTLKPYSRERHVHGMLVRLNPNIFSFKKHIELLTEKFKAMHESYGNRFVFENTFDEIEIDTDDKDRLRELYAERQFLFIHALLSMEKLGYIKIERLGSNWHWSESKPEKYEAEITLLQPFSQLADPIDLNNIDTLFADSEPSIASESEPIVDKNLKGQEPTYNNGTIKIGNRKVKLLNAAKNQRVICEALFSRNIGDWLHDYDIIHLFKNEKNPRSFYDAATAINKKIEDETEIEEMLDVSMNRIRINKKLFE